MRKLVITIAFFFVLSNVLGQSKKKDQEVDIINHEVKLGESVRLLSKKYLVDPAEIYKLNKFAVDGISEGMVLRIPVPRKEGAAPKPTESTENTELVNQQANSNEPVKKEEPINETPIPTPQGEIKQIIITEDKTEVSHKVLPKETLYSLARDYKVTVEDIKSANPEVASKGLQIGQIIKILTNKNIDVKQSTSIIKTIPKKEETNPKKEETKQVKEVPNTSANATRIVKHKVAPKETLYSLSKKYNVTVDEIKSQNANLLINGLQIGQVLEIKANN